MRYFSLVGVIAIFGAVTLAADASYDESFVSSFDRSDFMPALFDYPYGAGSGFDDTDYAIAPFDPSLTPSFRVYVKGNKLARVGALKSVIYDLENGTATVIDKDKRTYSVLTFAQLNRQLDKRPRCRKNCRIFIEDTGRTAKIDGVDATEYRVSAVIGYGESALFLAHATYWTVPTLRANALTAFAKTCVEKYAPQYADVCTLTEPRGFGLFGEATLKLPGYVMAKVVETRSRAAGVPLPRADASHAPWNVDTDPTPAQIRRTETRISNVADEPVSDAVFAVPQHYHQAKRKH